jgi:hypothetical protein
MTSDSRQRAGGKPRGPAWSLLRSSALGPVLACLLLGPASAASSVAATIAGGGAGHNPATRALEAAFKVALLERKSSDDGCYPPPRELAALLGQSGISAKVAGGVKQTSLRNLIYVLKQGAACGEIRMSLRAKQGVYLLDARKGTIEIVGARDRRGPLPGSGGPLRAIRSIAKSFRFSGADEARRLQVLCPGGTYPLGGGMLSSPAPGADGEGIYPHSNERLGAQRGWHVSPVLLDPAPASTTPRTVTVQAVCGKGLVPSSFPHKTVFVKPGQTKTAVARCPKGSVLIAGGFQRTNFRSQSGNYPTESRAAGGRAWRASGSAHGADGGELTAIAYCDASKRPLLTQVRSSSPPFAIGALATTTTPRCPRGTRLTSGGFRVRSSNAFLSDGGFASRGKTWRASAFGYFGPAPGLIAYGYCLKPGST